MKLPMNEMKINKPSNAYAHSSLPWIETQKCICLDTAALHRAGNPFPRGCVDLPSP